MLPSPSTYGLGFRGFKVFEATYAFTFVTARWLAHRPKDGFVSRLQIIGFPSDLLLKLQGCWLLPWWDWLPLKIPAFAGHTSRYVFS